MLVRGAALAFRYGQTFEDVLFVRVSDVEEAVDHRQVDGLPETSGTRVERKVPVHNPADRGGGASASISLI